jgi:hypothetical protein
MLERTRLLRKRTVDPVADSVARKLEMFNEMKMFKVSRTVSEQTDEFGCNSTLIDIKDVYRRFFK